MLKINGCLLFNIIGNFMRKPSNFPQMSFKLLSYKFKRLKIDLGGPCYVALKSLHGEYLIQK